VLLYCDFIAYAGICRMNRYEIQQFKKNNFFIPMESLTVVHYRWNHQRINFIGMFQRVGKTLHLHAIDYYRWNDRHINSIIKFYRVKNIAPPCHRPLHMESSTITYGIIDGLTPSKSFREVEKNYTHMPLTTTD